MPTFEESLAAIDDRFARFRDDRRAPGLAWGVIRDGALVHVGGAGTAVDGEDRVPDAEAQTSTESTDAASVRTLN